MYIVNMPRGPERINQKPGLRREQVLHILLVAYRIGLALNEAERYKYGIDSGRLKQQKIHMCVHFFYFLIIYSFNGQCNTKSRRPVVVRQHMFK